MLEIQQDIFNEFEQHPKFRRYQKIEKKRSTHKFHPTSDSNSPLIFKERKQVKVVRTSLKLKNKGDTNMLKELGQRYIFYVNLYEVQMDLIIRNVKDGGISLRVKIIYFLNQKNILMNQSEFYSSVIISI